MKLKARHLLHPLRGASIAKGLLAERKNTLACARRAEQHYGGDPRYAVQAVMDGYAPRIADRSDDTAVLHRICASYAVCLEGDTSNFHGPTQWWANVRNTNLKPVMRALAAGDTVALQQMYRSFFRDPCSAGLLIRAVDISVARHCRSVLGDALYRVDYWKEAVGDGFNIGDLQVPDTGNPFGVCIDGTLVRGGSEYQHYCAERVYGLLGNDAASVLEIGGGYGGMAYYLLHDHPGVQYIDFDLPETIALAAYYLIKTLPQRSFLLRGEGELGRSDVTLMPLHALSEVPSNSMDVTFSSHAISDLSPGALVEYLNQIARITCGHFLYIGNLAAGKNLLSVIAQQYPTLALVEARESGWHKFKDPGAQEVEFLFRAQSR